MTPEPKSPRQQIFLLTSSSPHQNGIGSIFLRDILAAASDFDVHWRVVEPFMLGSIRARSGIFWRALNAASSRLGILNNMRLGLFLSRRLATLADQIEEEFKASGATKIWVTTSSPELICLAQNLAERGIDIRATVWDAPEYLIQNLRLSKRRETQILERFRKLLRQARACSVVSDAMKIEYEEHAPDLPVVFMRHGIAPLPTIPKKDASANALRIVFAGSLYSKQEWNAFVQALEATNWTVAGRDIQLEFVGVFPLTDALRPDRLIQHPPMSQQEVLAFMAQADIGYLPYWLDPAKAFVARTSFPGKMTAYSAAGLAVFHHGPQDSSVTKFLGRYPYGVACHSLQTEKILEQLEALIKMTHTPTLHEARAAAMTQELSDTAMMRGFRALVTDMKTEPVPTS